MLIFFLVIILIILFCLSAFLSASETAFIGVNRIRLRNLVHQGIKRAKLVQDMIGHIDDFLITILIGNNFVNITISAIGTALFIYFLGNKWSVIFLATVIITFIVLIFCEITPKIFAASFSEQVSLAVVPVIRFLIKAFKPFSRVFSFWANLNIKLFGGTPHKRIPLLTEEEIKMMIEIGKQEGVVLEDEKKMLYRIFKFGDTEVKEVMIPVQEIDCIRLNTVVSELLKLWRTEGHSKIPVYEDSIDKIKGIIYARSIPAILKDKKPQITEDLLHPAYFINPQKKVIHLLREFQKMRNYIAIVHENGKTMGLVTLEDLIEEIVGEIEEENI
ncbi:MAG: hemolysin family protein [Candidatus Omnitrophota bacterium]